MSTRPSFYQVCRMLVRHRFFTIICLKRLCLTRRNCPAEASAQKRKFDVPRGAAPPRPRSLECASLRHHFSQLLVQIRKSNVMEFWQRLQSLQWKNPSSAIHIAR